MKKTCAFAIIFLILFSLAPALATNETNTTSTSSTTSQQNPDKTEKGFECLEEKAGDCSKLTTQEVALTILATPDNIFDNCVTELKDRQESNNWGNVKDTSLAVLALKHAGENTQPAEKWIIAQNQTPTDLVWYLQQDSNEQTECHIGYDTNDYSITVGENKKINKNAGTCLTLAQSSFWLQIAPECYDNEFQIECDKDFIANLLYKNKKSSTIYVLEGTESEPAFGQIKLKVNSKCFGTGSCDYEATAWATLALLQTGHNVEEFIPYVIAMADTNEGYLPEAFIYMLTNYEDYADQLITNQKLGNYWEAKSSTHNRYYDTALALIALGSSSAEQITKAKDWLLFSQASNGCWQNSIQDTAMVLWALEGRAGRGSSGGSTGVTYCSEANYFCIPSSNCPSTQDVGDNYFCPSLSETCCTSENLKSCSEFGGTECASRKICAGNTVKATDTNVCCTGTCEDRPQENECEANFYTCMDTCSEFQEPMSTYSCDVGQTCCRTKKDPDNPSSNLWIWILVLAILIVLGVIAYIKRENLKLLLFKLKTKFKKDKGRGGQGSRPGFPPRPGMPPRPGFPPIRRQQPPVAQPQRNYDRRDPEMSATFKKLQDMSK